MELNEEWNNFMHRICEVTKIVKDLSSNDKEVSSRASMLANQYLEDRETVIEDLGNNIKLKVKSDRTVINKEACHKVDKPNNPDEMDPEIWMAEVGRDAAKRTEEKKVRQERMETFRTRAVKAFKRGDFEKALWCYNKALEQIKDCCQLYTERALTLLKLKKYDKVLPDCEWAIRLNENSFKARLYKAKAHQGLGDSENLIKCREELMEQFPQHDDLVEYFLNKPESENEEDRLAHGDD